MAVGAGGDTVWSRCVSEQALDLRTLASPVDVPGHVCALVAADAARPALDLTDTPTPVLDLAAAGTRERALRDAAAAATVHRLRARGAAVDGIGAGSDWGAAVVRGLYALFEHDARARVGAAPRALRLAGWRDAPALTGARRTVDALVATQGRVDLYLFPALTIVPTVGAVLYRAAAPYRLHALACDLRVDRAVLTAIDRLLRALAVFTLLPPGLPDGTRPDPPPWLRAALAADADPAPPPETDGEVEVPDAAATGDLDALRARLRLLGLRARSRILYPSSRLPGDDRVTVAQCRVEGLPAPRSRPQATVWDPPDTAALGVCLPLQAKLGYEPSRVSASRVYHENSKIGAFHRDQPHFAMTDVPPPLYRLLGRAVRDAGRARVQYPLPTDADRRGPALEDVLRRRRSWAPVGDGPLALADLAHLLRCAYGVTGTAVTGRGEVRLPLRAVPSAGGLYSNDLYLLLDRVDGVRPGLYYYHPLLHRLHLVRDDHTLDRVADHTGYPDRVRAAAALVVYVASLDRLRWKYWERSYRMALLDCGHLAENVVLAATSVGLVAHPMIAYVDDYFNDLVGADGVDQVVLYLTLLGPAAPATAPATVPAPGGPAVGKGSPA